jgi:hypothetical protein
MLVQFPTMTKVAYCDAFTGEVGNCKQNDMQFYLKPVIIRNKAQIKLPVEIL